MAEDLGRMSTQELMMTLTPGWHFCAMKDGEPVLRDGAPLRIGHLYEHPGELRMCAAGYHDSERLIDALQYAPGAYLCRTLASSDRSDHDKRCSRYRIAVAGADVTRELHDFATRIAYCALLRERAAGREPGARSWEVIRTKRRWLLEQATDRELAAAEAAARAAGEAAGWVTAWVAADEMLLGLLPGALKREPTDG